AAASARMRRAGGDEKGGRAWCKRATAAFDRGVDKSSAEADLAAECAFVAIDDDLRATWKEPRYRGVVSDVKKAFERDLDRAHDAWFGKLQDVIDRYASATWSVAARAR